MLFPPLQAASAGLDLLIPLLRTYYSNPTIQQRALRAVANSVLASKTLQLKVT